MSYQVDMVNVLRRDKDASNFGFLLLKLVMKADLHNLALLRKAFPNAVRTIEEWRASGPEEIPDYPYD